MHMWLNQGSWDEGLSIIIWVGPVLITRVLKDKRGKLEGQSQKKTPKEVRVMWGQKQGFGKFLEARRRKKVDYSLDPPEGMQFCWHLILVQWNPLWSSYLQNCKTISLCYFKAARFMVNCYSSKEELKYSIPKQFLTPFSEFRGGISYI